LKKNFSHECFSFGIRDFATPKLKRWTPKSIKTYVSVDRYFENDKKFY
jgi:hypothetical protein